MDHVLEFITVFCDRRHHGKEEGLVFPALTSTGRPNLSGPIAVMLAEHKQARALVKEMVESWRRHRTGDKAAAGKFTVAVNCYIQLLTAHIQKENGVLFPIAERALSAETEQKAAVLPQARWVRVENAEHNVQGDNPRVLLKAMNAFFGEIGA